MTNYIYLMRPASVKTLPYNRANHIAIMELTLSNTPNIFHERLFARYFISYIAKSIYLGTNPPDTKVKQYHGYWKKPYLNEFHYAKCAVSNSLANSAIYYRGVINTKTCNQGCDFGWEELFTLHGYTSCVMIQKMWIVVAIFPRFYQNLTSITIPQSTPSRREPHDRPSRY